jgi:hypothetical protein
MTCSAYKSCAPIAAKHITALTNHEILSVMMMMMMMMVMVMMMMVR